MYKRKFKVLHWLLALALVGVLTSGCIWWGPWGRGGRGDRDGGRERRDDPGRRFDDGR
jgi:hypothetical protein